MSKTHYVRCEAVNLGPTVYDTEDLSTIRGAGLMILKLSDPVEKVCQQLGCSGIKVVTSGASQTVLQVTLPDSLTAEGLRDALETAFRTKGTNVTDNPLHFATLLVTVSHLDYDLAREALLAGIRFRQMQSLRFSPAGITARKTNGQPPVTEWTRPWCSIDLVRPGVTGPDRIQNPGKPWLSDSVNVRREYGFDNKQSFYKNLNGVNWSPNGAEKYEFAWDFQQIAEFDSKTSKAAREGQLSNNLNGKLAVLYIDGNQFGKKQRDFCRDEESQCQFDEHVQGRWRRAIKRVLDVAWSPQTGLDRLWWNDSKEIGKDGRSLIRLRLETLLWGGDEVIWVVPAWHGLAVINSFFDTISKKHDDPHNSSEQFGDFTYSAGLVFCHAEAPIRGILDLAQELAGFCKAGQSDPTNRFAYAVLESFDQLGADYRQARWEHLPFPPSKPPTEALDQLLSVDPAEFVTVWEALRKMKREFPHGAVYHILNELRKPSSENVRRLIDRALRDAPALKKDQDKKDALPNDPFALQTATVITDRVRMNWLMLAELWDYVDLGPYVEHSNTSQGDTADA